MRNSYLREPLVHFALIGALLFGINAVFTDRDESLDEIVVSRDRIDHLAAVFERRWQRPPSEQELHDLVENFIREEVLYREAMNLGLDRDDTVIRRRLRMKMEFLARDLVDAVDPGEKTLRDFHAANAEQYRRPARMSFRQVYFDRAAHENPESAVETARALLGEGVPEAELGDSSLLQAHYRDESSERLERVFGGGFAAKLLDLPRGQWSGPVESAYGLHLVFIEARQPRRVAGFDEVRAEVLRDWQRSEKQQVLEAQYENYRTAYRVRIDEFPGRETDGVAMQ
ncbi:MULTISPECIES: peptidyl-prolyl cis-trans isomerase [Microbulbifer]|uniref:peptidylprolyl isomerase n=1 Tax=Microbulbifer TaxID=48073 RepID=UPI001E4D07C7|nr:MULTISPECIES: peptidylprolyl isomerase [Microbulbifer]UHQ54663.1 peptidyl-prolyl cis-trans isomerase [Microbulbifer sp. YPW16]